MVEFFMFWIVESSSLLFITVLQGDHLPGTSGHLEKAGIE